MLFSMLIDLTFIDVFYSLMLPDLFILLMSSTHQKDVDSLLLLMYSYSVIKCSFTLEA